MSSAVLTEFPKVHVVPWFGEPNELEAHGYKEEIGLSYMHLRGGTESWKVNSDVVISRATTTKDVTIFSEVQSRGFIENPEAFDSWRPWLGDANLRNRAKENHSFYIGSILDRPVGVCLVVSTDETAGIYAVATLPEFRKRGISATIMQRAISNATQQGFESVGLQVVADSTTESFYRNLGFQRSGLVRVFGKQG
jgi:GNAT superfamily N-acetyltransferase